MAVGHINYNQGFPHASMLHNGLVKLEVALEDLNNIKGTMALMIDGDGSDATHFVYMKDKFGFDSTAIAKAAWEELNSLLFKLNTNASVTDVNAAMLQAFNKFR